MFVNRNVDQQIQSILVQKLLSEDMNTGQLEQALKPHSKGKVHAVLDGMIANGKIRVERGEGATKIYKLAQKPDVGAILRQFPESVQRANSPQK